MPLAALRLTFDLDYEINEPIEATLARAPEFNDRQGVIWKLWLRDPERGRGGGIYLFEDRESAQALVTDLVEERPPLPWTSNIEWEIQEVHEELSALTRAPLTAAPLPGTDPRLAQ